MNKSQIVKCESVLCSLHQNVSFLQAYSVKDSGIDKYLLIFNAISLSKYSEKVLTPDVGSKPHQ